MSRLATSVKSNCCQSEVNTERGSASVGNSSTEREKAGGFQDARGKKRVTRASTECTQTTKNPHIRQRTLLKSKGERRSTPENRDECCGQLRYTSFFSPRFPVTRSENYRANIRLVTKLRSNSLHTKTDPGTRLADVQHPEQFSEEEFLVDTLTESTSKTSKDVAKSESHDVEHDISSHRSTDGIQRGLALCDQDMKWTKQQSLATLFMCQWTPVRCQGPPCPFNSVTTGGRHSQWIKESRSLH
ncbi:hypothetical protein AMELA_G00221610 [Ameiurus melas]|uniref:Uncharacterized protein n=1 Tax=Ameiurus melas TaxID=219545 RepID=A0A7J6A174_AMEME|nr:hypothetical protein AMELA_G00221610 [Ameiurus melas]